MINQWNKSCISALIMVLCGTSIGVISNQLSEKPSMQTEKNIELTEQRLDSADLKANILTSSNIPNEYLEASESNAQKHLDQTQESNSRNLIQSFGTEALQNLARFDQEQISSIYGQMDDSLNELRLQVVDGSGKQIPYYSNAFEILSMASVYSSCQDPENQELFFQYIKNLWEASHSYSMSLSELYYCDTCMLGNDGFMQNDTKELPDFSEPVQDTKEESCLKTTADISPVIVAGSGEVQHLYEEEDVIEPIMLHSPANATPSDAFLFECPGHIDLVVQMKILGLDGNENLFSVDPIGNCQDKQHSEWNGWTQENISRIHALMSQDWYECYGLQTLPIQTGNALSYAEIDHYINSLPNGLSSIRKNVIRFALESVGRVPYYYGGKASRISYEGNHFGTIVSEDPKGRVLKGLDCSGWIGWVFWSVADMEIPYATTFSLSTLGNPIAREQLKPGDILLQKEDEAHAGIFLGWTEDGEICYIHESAGTNNNVVISVNGTRWTDYRNLLGD